MPFGPQQFLRQGCSETPACSDALSTGQVALHCVFALSHQQRHCPDRDVTSCYRPEPALGPPVAPDLLLLLPALPETRPGTWTAADGRKQMQVPSSGERKKEKENTP